MGEACGVSRAEASETEHTVIAVRDVAGVRRLNSR